MNIQAQPAPQARGDYFIGTTVLGRFSIIRQLRYNRSFNVSCEWNKGNIIKHSYNLQLPVTSRNYDS